MGIKQYREKWYNGKWILVDFRLCQFWGYFGVCQKLKCGSNLIPIGPDPDPGISKVKLYCYRCNDLFHCENSNLDSAYFGPNLPVNEPTRIKAHSKLANAPNDVANRSIFACGAFYRENQAALHRRWRSPANKSQEQESIKWPATNQREWKQPNNCFGTYKAFDRRRFSSKIKERRETDRKQHKSDLNIWWRKNIKIQSRLFQIEFCTQKVPLPAFIFGER